MKLCVSKCPSIPVVRKCCFCVPIRKGVIIFAYIDMILTLLSLPPIMFDMVEKATGKTMFDDYIIEIALTVSLLLIDVIMLTLLIVGAHKKNRWLLRIFLYVDVVFLAISVGTDIVYFDYTAQLEDVIYCFLLCLDIYLMFLVYNLIRVVEEGFEVQYMAYREGNQLS